MRVTKGRVNTAALAALKLVASDSIIRLPLVTEDNGFLNAAQTPSFGTPEELTCCEIVSIRDKIDERQVGKHSVSDTLVYVIDPEAQFASTDRIVIGGTIEGDEVSGGKMFTIDSIDAEHHFFGLLIPALYLSEAQ